MYNRCIIDPRCNSVPCIVARQFGGTCVCVHVSMLANFTGFVFHLRNEWWRWWLRIMIIYASSPFFYLHVHMRALHPFRIRFPNSGLCARKRLPTHRAFECAWMSVPNTVDVAAIKPINRNAEDVFYGILSLREIFLNSCQHRWHGTFWRDFVSHRENNHRHFHSRKFIARWRSALSVVRVR